MPTTYMGLTLPTPGPGGTPGPQYATMLNSIITQIDGHNHSGDGVNGRKLSLSALDITTSLSMAGYPILGVEYLQLEQQSALPSQTANVGRLVTTTAGDLYYVSPTTNVKIATTSGIVVSPLSLGFTGDYGTSAQAYYKNSDATFAFYATSSATYDTSVHADLMAGSLSLVKTNAQLVLRNGISGATVGGWRMRSNLNNSWQVDLAPSGSSTYISPFSVMPLGYQDMYGLGVNTTSGSGGPAFSLHLRVEQQTTFSDVEEIRLSHAAGGTASTGWGPRLRFLGAYATGSSSFSSMAAIQARLYDASSQLSGIALYGASGGSILTTPAFASDGNNSIGIGTYPTAAAAITFGASVAPTVNNVYDFGASSYRWGTVYSTSSNAVVGIISGSLTVPLVEPDTANSGSLGSTTKPYGLVYTNAGYFINKTPANPTSARDLTARHAANNCVAWAIVQTDGSITAGWNVASANWGSTGICQVTLRQGIENPCILANAVASTGSTNTYAITAEYVNTTTVAFKITRIEIGSGDADTNVLTTPFSFAVFGLPYGTT